MDQIIIVLLVILVAVVLYQNTILNQSIGNYYSYYYKTEINNMRHDIYKSYIKLHSTTILHLLNFTFLRQANLYVIVKQVTIL